MSDQLDEKRIRSLCEQHGLELRAARDPEDERYWVVDPDADRQRDDPEWAFPGEGRPAHHFPWKGGDLADVEDYLAHRGWVG